jgi:NTP pyrophosphatase (non-canonical NTP hydrolase)
MNVIFKKLKSMEWQKLTPENLPTPGSWILISDGTDWKRVLVTNDFGFIEQPNDFMEYRTGITHWCNVVLPKNELNQIKKIDGNDLYPNSIEVHDLYQSALDKWGFDPQLDQLTEECGELVTACNKLRRKGDSAVPLMIDEMADVEIMIGQIKHAMRVTRAIEERKIFKLNRLEERLSK